MKRLLLGSVAFIAVLAAAADRGPGMNRYTDKTPDQADVLPRPYPDAPPLIPHSIDGLAIKREGNDCLNCHLEGAEVAEGHKATKVPPSHFANAYTKEKRSDRPIGMRYNCLQCHTPLTE